MIQGKILILKWFLCLFIRAMKVTILAKNICNACYLYTRINHNGKRICLLFIYEFVHGTKKFENNCPFVIANQIKIYRDSSCIKISLTTSNFP